MKKPQQANSNFGEILSKWLSFKGRINQKEFWLYHVLPFVILYVSLIPLSNIFAIWVLLAGTVKRLHDSTSSGKSLIPFGILSIILFAISIAVLFFSFLGGMTGNVSANEFEEQLMILGLPILVLLLLPFYAGLKPSSPDENKYGSPPPPLLLGSGYKIALIIGIIISTVSLGYRYTIQKEDRIPNDPIMIQVIKKGNIKRLHTLLESGENPSQTSERGSTALMLAMYHRYSADTLSTLLLEFGANPNTNSILEHSNEWLHTPLIVAIKNHFYKSLPLDVIELMLEKGANPNPPKANQNEESPLLLAISFSHISRSISRVIPIIETVLTHGADPNLAENERALLEAITLGRVEVVNLLLDHGAELNSPINDSILQIAIEDDAFGVSSQRNKTFDMTKFLLAQNISLEQIANAKKWVENKLPNYKAQNERHIRNRLLEIQRLLTKAENNSGI